MLKFSDNLLLKIAALLLQPFAYPFWLYVKYVVRPKTSQPDRVVAPQEPKTVVITGASQGIGEGLVEYYCRSASSCRTIIMISRSREKLEEVKERLKDCSAGKDLILYPCDVTDAKGMKRILLEINQTYGQVDILYANAGLSYRQTLLTKSFDQAVRETFDVNVTGVVNTVMPLIEVKGVRQIAVVSSQAGYAPVFSPIYGTSKQWVTSFGRDLRQLLAAENVAVNVISPGPVKTPMLIGARPGSVERGITTAAAAEIIVRGLRRNEAEIVFPAQTGIFIYVMSYLPSPIAETLIAYVAG